MTGEPRPDALEEIALWDSKRDEAKQQLDYHVAAYHTAARDKRAWGKFVHFWAATYYNWQHHVAEAYSAALRTAFYREFGFGP